MKNASSFIIGGPLLLTFVFIIIFTIVAEWEKIKKLIPGLAGKAKFCLDNQWQKVKISFLRWVCDD